MVCDPLMPPNNNSDKQILCTMTIKKRTPVTRTSSRPLEAPVE